jgi:hypothetical protein
MVRADAISKICCMSASHALGGYHQFIATYMQALAKPPS